MKCDRCENPAQVHLTQVHGKNQTTIHLCQSCAGETAKIDNIAIAEEIKPFLREQFFINSITHFPASHQLRLYDGSLEPLHEHDWVVKVTVRGPLDSIGVVMDFHDLERRMAEVLNPMRGKSLNDLPQFAANNPSAENVAKHIGDSLSLPASVRLTRIEVWETPENSAVYQPSMRLPSTPR
jgi:6-pyruvoyltetrahydropterin/6-carboxytetrahydropterin synthase